VVDRHLLCQLAGSYSCQKSCSSSQLFITLPQQCLHQTSPHSHLFTCFDKTSSCTPVFKHGDVRTSWMALSTCRLRRLRENPLSDASFSLVDMEKNFPFMSWHSSSIVSQSVLKPSGAFHTHSTASSLQTSSDCFNGPLAHGGVT
jgi:hypothetical protein